MAARKQDYELNEKDIATIRQCFADGISAAALKERYPNIDIKRLRRMRRDLGLRPRDFEYPRRSEATAPTEGHEFRRRRRK